jgi:hypothetical protein
MAANPEESRRVRLVRTGRLEQIEELRFGPRQTVGLHELGHVDHGDALPRRVDAVVDNIAAVTWSDSLKAVKRGGVLGISGITTAPSRRQTFYGVVSNRSTCAAP